MLPTHTTSTSIVLTSSRQATTLDSSVSRCANVRGGRVHLDTGSLGRAGLSSYYWSATTYPNATDAYNLDFGRTNAYPSHYTNRFYGFSVRGGHVYLDTGSLRNAGDNSNYWSATTYPNTTNAYYFHFYSTNVYPSIYYNRFFGFSVRCIVFFFPFFLFLLSPFSHFSLLTSPFSLLTSPFSLLPSHFSLLTSHFSLLTSHFSLPYII